MFIDSAERLGVEPRVWLYKVGDEVAGQMGAQFVQLKVGNAERTTAWFVDTMVLPQYRDQGIGASLLLNPRKTCHSICRLVRQKKFAESWKKLVGIQLHRYKPICCQSMRIEC